MQTYWNASAAFYMPFTRAWELLLGCSLASYSVFGQKDSKADSRLIAIVLSLSRSVWVRNVSAWLGIFLIVVAVIWYEKTAAYPGWRAMLPALGAALIIAAGPYSDMNRLFLSNRVMVYIGLISYPLYLWHWPLLSFSRVVESGEPGSEIKIAAVFLAFVLAMATYHWLEKPLRERSARKVAPWFIVFMIFVALAGVYIDKSKGFPSRFADHQEKLATIKWAVESEAGCQSVIPVKTRYCRIGDDSHPPTAVILGDSHGNRLFDGLVTRIAESGGNLLQLGEGGCPPLWNVRGGAAGGPDTCLERTNGQIEYVTHTSSIKKVFLVSRGPLYMTGKGYGEVEKDTRIFLELPGRGNLSYAEIFELGLRDSVKLLLQSGKQIILVIDNPELGFNPLSCISSRPWQFSQGHHRSLCAVPRTEVGSRNREYRDLIARISMDFPSINIVDTQQMLCDQEYCWALKNDELLYMDGDHLNKFGTAMVVRKMPAELFQ